MNKLLFLCPALLFVNLLSAQEEFYIGEEPLDNISVPYLIVSPYANLNFISITLDYGQDCRQYNQVFQAGALRQKCNGLNDETGSPVEMHSLAYMMNIFARRGYELDRILPGTDPDDPFDQWDAQYVFRKRIN